MNLIAKLLTESGAFEYIAMLHPDPGKEMFIKEVKKQ